MKDLSPIFFTCNQYVNYYLGIGIGIYLLIISSINILRLAEHKPSANYPYKPHYYRLIGNRGPAIPILKSGVQKYG